MGLAEEMLGRRYYLVDTKKMRFQHIIMMEITIVIFIPYAVFLWLLFSLAPSILSALLLIGTQVGLGIPVTRAYNDLGLSARNKIEFHHHSFHESDEKLTSMRIRTADLPLLFERLMLQVQKYDKGKLDDLMDISWFLVIVWAVISAGTRYVNYPSQLLSLVGVFALLIACIMAYMSGYLTKREFSFEEYLEHLEYYIISLIRSLETVRHDMRSSSILILSNRGRKSLLIDIVAEFVVKNITLEYHMGLSSNLLEKFVVQATDSSILPVCEVIRTQQCISEYGWTIECFGTEDTMAISVKNPNTKLRISDPSSYVLSPVMIEKASRTSKDIMSSIVSAIEGTCES